MFLNGYPYTDFHEMNLDFLLKSMETLKQAFANFTASNSLIFAEPLLFDITKSYAKNTIVLDPDGNAYISLQQVPSGIQLSNTDYWLMVFNFEEYTEKANKNFTVNYLRDTTRAPQAYVVGDWLVLDDVLYTVTQAIAADELLVPGTNLTHFTVEQFLKDFITSVNTTLTNWYNQMTGTINQYKNDIDASELAYRNQLAQDITNTVSNLQSQLDAAISGVTVDSEVINARVELSGNTASTLRDAIQDQDKAAQYHINDADSSIDNEDMFFNNNASWGYRLNSSGTLTEDAAWVTTDFIPVTPGNFYRIYRDHDSSAYSRKIVSYDSSQNFVRYNDTNGTEEDVWYCESDTNYIRVSYSINVYKAGLYMRPQYSRIDSIEDAGERSISRIKNIEDFIDIHDYILDGMSNGRLVSTGLVQADEFFMVTDFIPVNEGDILSLIRHNDEMTAYTMRRCWYDSNKDLVDYYQYSPIGKRSYQVPSGVAYARFSFSHSVYDAGISLIKEPSGKYNIAYLNDCTNKLKLKNLFDIGVFYTVRLTTDGVLENDNDWVTTDYIPVKPGEYYTMERLHDTADYSCRRAYYDENKDNVDYVKYTSGYTRDLMVPDGVAYIRYSFSYSVYTRGITFRYKYNALEDIKNSLVECNDRTAYKYTGNEINVKNDKSYRLYPIMKAASPNAPSGTTAQGFAIYGGVLFQFMADNAVRLYDMATGAIIANLSCTCGHGNGATFSNVFYDPADEFPICYVTDSSEETGGVHVYGLRITRSAATLVKTLYFAYSDFTYPIQFTLDNDHGYAWLLCPHITSPAQYSDATFYKCDMNDLIDNGNDTYTPRVLRSFNITSVGTDLVTQGIKYLNNQLFLTSGGSDTSIKSVITVIDLVNENVKAVMNSFPEPIYSHELEDCDFVLNPYTDNYDMVVYIRTYGYYRLVFNH